MILLQTYLFVPATRQELIQKAIDSSADVVIVDLEDAVAEDKKEFARQLLGQASKLAQEKSKPLMVRINGVNTGEWRKDIQAILEQDIKCVMLPKTEIAEDIKLVTGLIEEAGEKNFSLVPLIESAKGVLNAFEIALSHSFVQRLAFGSVDYVLDIGAELTKEENELLFARSQLINVSAAANLDSLIDGPYIDYKDDRGFIESVERGKKLGIHSKLLIHPKQIEIFERAYQPTPQEMEDSALIIQKFEKSLAEGVACISYKGRMVDYPVYRKAKALQARYLLNGS